MPQLNLSYWQWRYKRLVGWAVRHHSVVWRVLQCSGVQGKYGAVPFLNLQLAKGMALSTI